VVKALLKTAQRGLQIEQPLAKQIRHAAGTRLDSPSER